MSGSVSLELLYHVKPTVVLYWISPLAYAVQQRFRRVKYITLVNLLAGGEMFPADTTPYDPDSAEAPEVLFPEYLTCEDRSPQIAKHVVGWLTDASRAELVERLARLRAEVGHGGAAASAANTCSTPCNARPRCRARTSSRRPTRHPRAAASPPGSGLGRRHAGPEFRPGWYRMVGPAAPLRDWGFWPLPSLPESGPLDRAVQRTAANRLRLELSACWAFRCAFIRFSGW